MKRILSLLTVPALACAAPASASPARSFTIGGAAFEESDIADARAQPELGGKATILITFEPAAAERLRRLSKDWIMKTLPIRLNEKVIFEPILAEALTGDSVQIPAGNSIAEADQLARLISGKEPLPDSLEGDEP